MKVIEKPILKTLFVLSWPLMVGEAMQLMYNLADTIWVGRLGEAELAAISLSFPLLFIMFSVAGGFSMAGTTLVSQYTGADKGDEANKAAGQILMFAVLISFLFSGLGLIFGENLLTLMNAEPEVVSLAWEYFRILLLGAPLMFIYFIFSSVMQGVGNTKTPMKIKIITVIVNIILDPFLIFGWFMFPELGIAGAAVATIISRMLASGIALYILFSQKMDIKISMSHLYPNRKVLKKIIKIGSPAAIGMSALAIAMTVMTYIVTAFGTAALAAWGIVSRITSVIRLPSHGLGMSTGVLVGQNLGADQFRRAEKSAWIGVKVNFAIMMLLAFLNLVFAPQLVRPFTSSPEVLSIATTYLRIAGFAFAFLGIQEVVSGALKGAGKTVEQMIFRVLTLWVMQIPFAYLLSYTFNWGVNGIWWGIFFAKLIGATALIVWFKRGTWKQSVVRGDLAKG